MTTYVKAQTSTTRRVLLAVVAALGIAAAGMTALPASDAAARPCNLYEDVEPDPWNPYDRGCRN
jgi:hypothetical protein